MVVVVFCEGSRVEEAHLGAEHFFVGQADVAEGEGVGGGDVTPQVLFGRKFDGRFAAGKRTFEFEQFIDFPLNSLVLKDQSPFLVKLFPALGVTHQPLIRSLSSLLPNVDLLMRYLAHGTVGLPVEDTKTEAAHPAYTMIAFTQRPILGVVVGTNVADVLIMLHDSCSNWFLVIDGTGGILG